jgi:SAM-dependent methyltransferase
MELEIAPDLVLRYDCAREALPLELAARFVQFEHGTAARAFVAQALSAPHGRLATLGFRALRRFVSDYDAYGLLHMYPMHLLDTAQFARMLGWTGGVHNAPRGRLLDAGAGDGGVTAHAAPLFTEVAVTEASSVLRRRLRARGFRVLDCDLSRSPLPSGERFDAVLLLNVLDRCAYPRSLLRHARAALAPEGVLLVSVPLPLAPHVQAGGSTVDPEEPLPPPATSWELGAAELARDVLAKAGLRVLRLSRAPYLSRGDAQKGLYVLDAALFACAAEDD